MNVASTMEELSRVIERETQSEARLKSEVSYQAWSVKLGASTITELIGTVCM